MISTFKCGQEAEPIEQPTKNDGSIINAFTITLRACECVCGWVCACMQAGTCPCPRLCVLSCVRCEFVFVCLFTRSLPPNLALAELLWLIFRCSGCCTLTIDSRNYFCVCVCVFVGEKKREERRMGSVFILLL